MVKCLKRLWRRLFGHKYLHVGWEMTYESKVLNPLRKRGLWATFGIVIWFTASAGACDSIPITNFYRAHAHTASSAECTKFCSPPKTPDTTFRKCDSLAYSSKYSTITWMFQEDHKSKPLPDTVDAVATIQIVEFTGLRSNCPDTLYPISPDTSRFYPKVDTVGRWYHKAYKQQGDSVYIPDSFDFDIQTYGLWVTVVLDTTWLPKVQIFLDSAEYGEYEAWKKSHQRQWITDTRQIDSNWMWKNTQYEACKQGRACVNSEMRR